MKRTNTSDNVAATGIVQVDAGTGVNLEIPVSQVGVYQSGLRDISGELMNGWTGTLFVEREGKNVYFRGQLNATDATDDIAWMLPAGFRPGVIQSGGGNTDYGSGIAWSQNNPPRIYRINHYLHRFQLVGASGETSPISVNHSLRTPDPAPSSTPGVSA